MRIVVIIISLPLVVITSPVMLRHQCGLTSWPLEWFAMLGSVGFAIFLIGKAKQGWKVWAVVLAAPVVSIFANLMLAALLHWNRCPRFLLDAGGRAWRDRTTARSSTTGSVVVPKQIWPNKSLQPTPTAVMPPAAQEIMPAVGVAEH
jgi:hypothetical protein